MIQVSSNRLVAAIIVGLLGSWYALHDYTKWFSRGREAFLADQAHRFDTSMLIRPAQPFSASLLRCF